MEKTKREKALEMLGFNFSYEPSLEQIKDEFRKAAFKYHPDKNPYPDAINKFLLIKKAYDFLLKEDDDFDLEENDNLNDIESPDEYGYLSNEAGYRYWWLKKFGNM
jgi:curved DNA-binding protein CbpA